MVDAFIAFLKAEAGGSLRAVASYGETGVDIQYLRSSIDPGRARNRIKRLHSHYTGESVNAPDLDAFGPVMASVTLYPEAVSIHFPLPDTTGIITTLDVDAARHLHEFTQACLTYLNDNA